jgi:hypothetical protein
MASEAMIVVGSEDIEADVLMIGYIQETFVQKVIPIRGQRPVVGFRSMFSRSVILESSDV